MIEKDLHFGYYKTDSSKSSKYGHRRLFTTELKTSTLTELMKNLKRDTYRGFDYEYILKIENIESNLKNICNYINNRDEKQMEKRMKEVMDSTKVEILSEVKEMKGIFNMDIGYLKQKIDEVYVISMKHEEIIIRKFEEMKDFIKQNQNTRVKIVFDFNDPVQPFVGRDNEMHEIHEFVKSNIVVISGLAGMGKTELVRQYAFKYKDFFDGNIVWINSETPETLNKSFEKLAQALQIATSVNSIDKHISLITDEIYSKMSDSQSLFIFDNADSLLIVQSFLPKVALHNGNIKVLMTSQIQEWHRAKIINLQELNESEAVQLVMESLSEYMSSLNDETIVKLVKAMQCFPLALQQAIAYIIDMSMTEGNYDVEDYIKKFENENEMISEFLFDGNVFPEYFDNRYTKTTFTTIKMVLEKLENKQLEPNLSLAVLNAIAYLAPDDIPEKIFLYWMEQDSLNKVIRNLKKYSLIKVVNNMIFVHRMVQKIIRFIAKDRGIETNTLMELLDLTIVNNSLDILSEHVSSVLKYVQSQQSLILDLFSAQNDRVKAKIILLLSYNNCCKLLKIVIEKELRLINCIDHRDRTPLHLAALNKNKDIIVILVENGANLNKQDAYKRTPVFVSVERNDFDQVNYFVDKGADLNIEIEHRSILITSIYAGNVSLFRYLFEKCPNQRNNKLLHIAAQHSKDIVMFLLENNYDVNVRNKVGETPLHYASMREDLTIPLLVRNGALINAQSHNGNTPLHEATRRRLTTTASTLLKLGADKTVKNNDGQTALHEATVTNAVDTVQLLIENGSDVNEVRKDGQTAFHIAVLFEYKEIINLLSSKSAKLDISDLSGITPLYIATVRRNKELIKFILNKGADVHTNSNDGYTLLHEAAIRGYSYVARLLCSFGADVNIKAMNDRYPLHDAVICDYSTRKLIMNRNVNMTFAHIQTFQTRYDQDSDEHVNHVMTFLELGANVESRTDLGHTALHEAVICGLYNVVFLLISKGASVNTRCNAGFTPLHDAIIRGFNDIARILIKNGTDLKETESVPSIQDFCCYFQNDSILKLLTEK